MNHSISSTVTGKTKIKVVFLGGQSVGKSSIIEKYIHDRFDDTANVLLATSSLPSASISLPKISHIGLNSIACSSGIPQGSNASDR